MLRSISVIKLFFSSKSIANSLLCILTLFHCKFELLRPSQTTFRTKFWRHIFNTLLYEIWLSSFWCLLSSSYFFLVIFNFTFILWNHLLIRLSFCFCALIHYYKNAFLRYIFKDGSNKTNVKSYAMIFL